MISDAMAKVGRKQHITVDVTTAADNNLIVVEGMQFERGYISPYFVTDSERMTCDYDNCKLLLVDKKVKSARDMIVILEEAIKSGFPLLIIATVVKDELGLSLDKVGVEVLGNAARVELGKESCTIVGDGSTNLEVEARVKQINRLIEGTEAEYEKEKLQERAARLSGGVAIIQVGAQTETELKEKKLRVEDALNATKAAVEEGIVIGGGTTFLKLGQFVDGIKEELDNDEQRLGADIIKRALSYPMRLVAFNSGVNGSVTA